MRYEVIAVRGRKIASIPQLFSSLPLDEKELMVLLELGIFLMLLGFLLAIFTGNLFPDSLKVQQQFEELKRKQEQGKQLSREESGKLTYFKLNHFIYRRWKYIVAVGLFIFAISFYE